MLHRINEADQKRYRETRNEASAVDGIINVTRCPTRYPRLNRNEDKGEVGLFDAVRTSTAEQYDRETTITARCRANHTDCRKDPTIKSSLHTPSQILRPGSTCGSPCRSGGRRRASGGGRRISIAHYCGAFKKIAPLSTPLGQEVSMYVEGGVCAWSNSHGARSRVLVLYVRGMQV